MVHADGTIRTDEMSLTAVLIMNGYAPVMMRGRSGCVWVIQADEVDELAEEIVDDFVRGACRVEPKRFIREVAQVRKEMYKFLNLDHVRIVREENASS